jgi:hypothetical protein
VAGRPEGCDLAGATRVDGRGCRSAGRFRRRPDLCRLPHGAIRCLEGLASRAGDAAGHDDNCARRLRGRVARAFWGRDHLLPQWRQVHGPHRRPRWRAARLSGRLHLRGLSTTAIFDRVSGRTAAGARHRLGQPAERGGRPALVPSLPRPAAQARRPAVLDRARPDLELPVRRLPLDRSEKELRPRGQHLRDQLDRHRRGLRGLSRPGLAPRRVGQGACRGGVLPLGHRCCADGADKLAEADRYRPLGNEPGDRHHKAPPP